VAATCHIGQPGSRWARKGSSHLNALNDVDVDVGVDDDGQR